MTIRRIALIALMAAASPLAVAGTAHADTATDSPAAKEWWPKSVDLTSIWKP